MIEKLAKFLEQNLEELVIVLAAHMVSGHMTKTNKRLKELEAKAGIESPDIKPVAKEKAKAKESK